MNQSESIKTLLESMAKAQSEFVTLPKDKNGYGYKYTDLDTVITTVRPILAKYNLGFMQTLTTLETGKNGITSRIFNTSGEWIEDTIALPDVSMAKTNAAQNMGAAITYMKRYALCAMLGISSDEDTDAATPAQDTPQRNASAPQKKGPKGGADTPEQKKAINEILGMKFKDGSPIFTKADFEWVGKLRLDNTADEVIERLKAGAEKRKSEHKAKDTEQFPEDIPYEQNTVSEADSKGASDAFDLY